MIPKCAKFYFVVFLKIYVLFLKKSSLLLGPYKLNYDDKGRVYKNCNLPDPRSRASCAGAWPYM